MTVAVTAFDYLKQPAKFPAQSVNAIFGDEPFLQRAALAVLRDAVLEGEDAEFATTQLAGDVANWRDISDELATASLFGGGRRLVVIEAADDFVSEHRPQLEQYVADPSPTGVLVLVVSKWPKNTRLYKALGQSGLQVDCAKPKEAAIVKWLKPRCKSRHGAKLAAGAAEQLVELIGPELGLLDQELAKLALMAGDDEITPQLVRDMTGGWRTKTAWEMLDAACEGNAAVALRQLENLIHAGEHPIAILAQISYSLRRLAAATRLFIDSEKAGRRMSLRKALEQAGVKPFLLGKYEAQLKRIGRERCAQMYRWLLDADLALKGVSSAPDRARLVLEELLVRIAAPKELAEAVK